MANDNNKKQRAVITGASSGIGKALAAKFASEGFDVIMCANQRDTLIEAAEHIRIENDVDVQTVVADLSTFEGNQQLYDAATSSGQVDVFCGNAGFGEYGNFATETSLEKELNMIDLNIKSIVQLTKLFSKDMVASKNGKILLTASIVSFVPDPYQSVYAGTKSFVYNFAQGIRERLKESNVTVTALLPGATDTNFFFEAGATESKIYQDGPLADPNDVAKAGYDALMANDDHVVHGLKNKLMVEFAELAPSPIAAKMNAAQMAPKKKAS